MTYELYPAMKAFIIHNGKILILREKSTYVEGTNLGKYDVSGGRVRPEEKFEDGLIREVKEETSLDIKIGKPFTVGEWWPIIGDRHLHIVATFFECFADSDKIALSEDHDDYQWINAEDYKNYNIIETNIPAFENYLKLKNK